MSERIATKHIGKKFNPDGSVRFFPGNTVISKIGKENPVYPVLTEIARSFRESDTGKKFAFLPEESYHMTVIQGVCGEERSPELWSRFLPTDAPLEQTDRLLEEQFRRAHPLPRTVMKFDYLDLSGRIILVRLLPETEKDAENLRAYREEISELTGIRFPDHDRYRFHVSIAYQLWEMEEKETAAMEAVKRNLEQKLREPLLRLVLEQPEATYFQDMFFFSSERLAR